MSRARRARAMMVCCAALGLLTLGCSDDSPARPADAGVDAPADRGPDPDVAAGDRGAADAAAARIEIPGLDGVVDAVYDEHGILHLSCSSDEDCLAALGYFHAANRFFPMDFLRHLMRGRLARMLKVGKLALDTDFPMRQMMTSTTGQPLEELTLQAATPQTVKLVERYSAGINAWLADLAAQRNGAVLPREYSNPFIASKVPPPWEPEDSMAVALYLMDDLGNTTSDELRFAELAAALPPALAADVLNPRPAFSTFTLYEGQKPVRYKPAAPLDRERFTTARRVLRAARETLLRARRFSLGGGASNNWAVAPQRTAAKRALLANDPHLALLNPSIWMPVELDAKTAGSGTLHVAGGTVPGIPAVLIGRNEQLAWGVTTANIDLNEVYLEQLNDAGDAVIFQGQEVPLIEKTFTFANAAGDPVDKTFKWVPHHGPLLAEDPASKTGVSVRWVPQEGLTDVDAFFALARSERVADVPAALQKITAADQNFVVIDTAGNIGWFPYGKVPSRPWASAAMPPWLPVPGDGSAEWAGFIKPELLPQAQNPASGVLLTANQAFSDAITDGDPFNDGKPAGEITFQALTKNPGARAQRIAALLAAGGDAHSADTMLALQADTFSLLGELVAPELIQAAAAATLAPEATKVVDALAAWKYSCPTGLASSDPAGAAHGDAAVVQEAVGCTAFHAALGQLFIAALGDEIDAAGVGLPSGTMINLLVLALTEPAALQSNIWDDVATTDAVETKQDVMLRALLAAASALQAWQPDAAQWQWGRTHTLSLRSIYDQFGVPAYNHDPLANDGALETVDVANPNAIRSGKIEMSHTNGASLRMVAEATETGLTMKWQYPGGASMYPDSPRYNQLLDRYLANEAVDFPFGAGAVTKPDETLQLHPAP